MMQNTEQDDSERERQLDAIIAEYYRLAEKREAPVQATFIARYPDFQQELCEFFADLCMFQYSGRSDNEDQGLEPTIIDSTSLQKTLAAGAAVKYFGVYEILEELGSGGMGIVYKARHTRLRKLVALKMIRAGEFATDFQVKMFKAEARAAAKLDHPGIVAVHEVGMHAGQHFYTMDYVAGGSLSKLHRDEPVAARRAAELVRQMAEAIHYAHGKGIVHRDLKPANVLLTTTDVPRISDFGLAKRIWADEDSMMVHVTETGQVLGTVGYMSREQAEGKTRLVGEPTDIYSLGAVLYALLTSRAPFVGESQADTILQVIHQEPLSPRTLNPSVPRDLETICLKCLEKEPNKRYSTAVELADDLARFLENKPVLARPVSTVERSYRWCRRNPWAAAALSLVLLVAVGSPLVATQFYRLAVDRETARRETADKATELETSLVAERNAKSQASTALDESRWQVYRLRLMKMEQLWRDKDWGHLERLLVESVPAEGEKDLRGWEWHYLQSQLERRIWRIYDKPEKMVAFDWDRHTGKLAVYRAGAVDVWLPRERRLLRSISVSGLPYGPRLLRWSPDHRHFAVCGGKLKIQVVDSETAQIVCKITHPELPQEGNWVSHLDWSPSGDCLAVSISGRSIQLWKVAQEPVLFKSLVAHEGVLPTRIHWSPNQTTCVTISRDGWATYWKTDDWTPLEKKRILSEWCSDVAWSPDGTHMAFATSIGLIASADGTVRKRFANQGSWICQVLWLDNERLVTANEAQELRIVHLDQQTPDEVFPLRMHSQLSTAFSVGPDEQIASAAPGESVKVWYASEVAPEHLTLPGARLPRQAAACMWHTRSNVLGLVSQHQGTTMAATWSPGASQVENIPLTNGASSVHWHPSADAIVVETTGGSWQTVSWPQLAPVTPTVTTQRMGPLYSADLRFRVDAQFYTQQIAIVDTLERAATVQPNIDTLNAYAWHPSEPWLAIAQQHFIRLCHPLREKSVWVVTPYSHQLQVTRCLAWSHDGKYLLVGEITGIVRVLDGVTLEIVHTLRGHSGAITVVAWSNDGTRIVSAGEDGFLRWWDAAQGLELFKMPITKSDKIYELRFSADGRWLAGRTAAGKVPIWTTTSPQTPTYLEGSIAPLTAEIERNPNNQENFLRRGRWFAVRHQWSEARSDFERAHALDSNDRFTQANVAAICLLLQDFPAYEQHCATIEAELVQSQGSELATFELIRALLLGPIDLPSRTPEWQNKLDTILAKNAGYSLADRYLAMAFYRSGQWGQCITAVDQLVPAGPPERWQVVPLLFRAMALEKLGYSDKAKGALADIKQYMEAFQFNYDPNSSFPRDKQQQWFAEDGMFIQIVWQEALRLISKVNRDAP